MAAKNPLTAYRESQSPPMSKAALAKHLEVSRSIAHRWEAGLRKIGLKSLPKVSEKTGIPERDLRPDLAAAMNGRAA